LAKEPNQLTVMAKLAEKLIDSGILCKIVLVDYFTYVYGKDFIIKLQNEYDCKIITSEKIFRTWQVNSNPTTSHQSIQSYFSYWSEKFANKRTLEKVLKTDAYSNNYERGLSCFEISNEWVLQSHYDVLKWCEEVTTKHNPDLFVSIDIELLPTNVFFEMSQTLEIPFITFIDSRILDRWVYRKDFAYGMSEELQAKIFSCKYESKDNPDVENFIKYFTLTNIGSYNSLSSNLNSNSRKYFSHIFRYFQILSFDLLKYFWWVLKMIKSSFTTRAFKVIRFDQSFRKLWKSEFKRLIAPYKIRFDKKFITKVDGIEKFFFWSLHDRPEGSGLVQGDGLDEIDILIEFARLVPKSTKILVKENSLIYGLRSNSIYNRLLLESNIILVNPFVSSREFIARSVAVVGISGTVLLEAGMLNKPSWALGSPEFAPALCGFGFDGIQKFISDCITNSVDISKIEIRIRQYLKFIFENSTIVDSSISRTHNLGLMNYNIERMFNIVMNELGCVSSNS
jgi:hypothetical protein